MDKAAQKRRLTRFRGVSCYFVDRAFLTGQKRSTNQHETSRMKNELDHLRHHVDLLQMGARDRKYCLSTVFVALHVPRGRG